MGRDEFQVYKKPMIIKFRYLYIDFLKVILYKNRVLDNFFLLDATDYGHPMKA